MWKFCSIWGPSPGPSWATAGHRKPLSRGPITTSFCMHREGGNMESCVPSPSDYKSGEHHKLPSGVPGRKWILCIFEVRKKAVWNTFFSIFERWRPHWRAPQTSWSPGKLPPPLSPLSTGLSKPSLECNSEKLASWTKIESSVSSSGRKEDWRSVLLRVDER